MESIQNCEQVNPIAQTACRQAMQVPFLQFECPQASSPHIIQNGYGSLTGFSPEKNLMIQVIGVQGLVRDLIRLRLRGCRHADVKKEAARFRSSLFQNDFTAGLFA